MRGIQQYFERYVNLYYIILDTENDNIISDLRKVVFTVFFGYFEVPQGVPQWTTNSDYKYNYNDNNYYD